MPSPFRSDVARVWAEHDGAPVVRRVYRVATHYGLVALAVFRFGKVVRRAPLALRLLGVPLHAVLVKLVETNTGIRISPDSEIGPGAVINNFGGVVIHGTLGRDCTIIQGAQLIARADHQGRGWPTLGDRVFVGAGARVLGNVTIGDDVRIGANAVVMTDIPPGSVVMPPQSRVLVGFYRWGGGASPPRPAALPSGTGAAA
jgi:serine O-acetyltransferase